MTLQSSYQPFLIGEGKSKTGYFTYLDSWIKPEDAFDTLVNAYVYRGALYQRAGMQLFPSANGAGALVYADSIQGATGTGANSSGGTLTKIPVVVGGFTVRTLLSSGVVETWTDPLGNGVLVGDQGDNGTIVYATGVWTISTAASATTIALGQAIWVTWSYVPTNQTPKVNNPIMGIKQFINETTDQNVLLVMDTRRASYWAPNTKSFVALNNISQNVFEFPLANALTAPAINPFPLQWWLLTPFSVVLTIAQPTAGTTIYRDNGTGGFIKTNAGPDILNLGVSAIVYGTSTSARASLNLTMNSAPNDLTLVSMTFTVNGDYFTGNNTNFFNATNWGVPDVQVPSFLYFCNNVDPITTFDGTNLARPAFSLYEDSVVVNPPASVLFPYINDIATTLDIKVYQNSLLFLAPTIYNDTNPRTKRAFAENQSIYYSCPSFNLTFSPGNFVITQQIAGNGGYVPASTGDIIQASQLLRDVLVVFFTNSTWIFRDTGNFTDPFRFYQLNVSRSTNAPYGSAPYDLNCTSLGSKGMIQCDGVGVDRFDIAVIDLFENINQNVFHQCFSQKYDNSNQTWTLFPTIDTGSITSDRIMVFNYLENTWAIFKANLGNLVQTPTSPNTFSCLGLGFTTSGVTWNDLATTTWEQLANTTWNSLILQSLAPSLLMGDQNGFVYLCDDGPADFPGPAGTASNGIATQIITKRLNPYIGELGEKARFGYLDIYYAVNPGTQIMVNIYGNNGDTIYRSFVFTLDSTTGQEYAWKRFYINVVAEFVQIELNSIVTLEGQLPTISQNTPFKISGMILWASPAGRLVPGSFV